MHNEYEGCYNSEDAEDGRDQVGVVDILLLPGIKVYAEEEDSQDTQSIDEDYDVRKGLVDDVAQPSRRLRCE